VIVIDTSVAVGFLRGEETSVRALESARVHTDSIGISAVSIFELLAPLRHRKLREQERVLKSFVHELKTLPLDSIAVDESADIMGSLLRIGKPVNALDVLIAGTAVANGAEKLLSKDTDFETIASVSDLTMEVIKGL
jgi:hypothetical protein